MGEPISVVIVDDEEGERSLLRTRLERVGGFVVLGEAENGEEAIATCAELRPDAVVLDVGMPVLNGIDAVPGIRRGSPRTIVVIYTPDSGLATRDAAEKVGAHAVVGKLDSFDLLVGVLHRFVPAKAPANQTAQERAEFTKRMSTLLGDEEPEAAARRAEGSKTRVGLIVALVVVGLPLMVAVVWLLAFVAGLSR